jgi:hypothetical protein
MTLLGILYTSGEGVEKNFAVAARWYKAATDKGDLHAIGLAPAAQEKDDDRFVTMPLARLNAIRRPRIGGLFRGQLLTHLLDTDTPGEAT